MNPVVVEDAQDIRVWRLHPLGVAVAFTVPLPASSRLPSQFSDGQLRSLSLYLEDVVDEQSAADCISFVRTAIVPRLQRPFAFRAFRAKGTTLEVVE